MGRLEEQAVAAYCDAVGSHDGGGVASSSSSLQMGERCEVDRADLVMLLRHNGSECLIGDVYSI